MKPGVVAAGVVVSVLTLTGVGVAVTTITETPSITTPPPGAYNSTVTQETIGLTICVAGWTKTIRPSTSYTTPLKIQQMKDRHLSGTTSAYEEDHLVPLELGGSPKDPNNLWPEAIAGAHLKDRAENRLHRAVCDHTLTLCQAQAQILIPANWH